VQVAQGRKPLALSCAVAMLLVCAKCSCWHGGKELAVATGCWPYACDQSLLLGASVACVFVCILQFGL
jgi:hypothetical protein